MTSSSTSFGVHGSLPQNAECFPAMMTSSLPLLATSEGSTVVRRPLPRRHRTSPTGDGDGNKEADWAGSGRGIPLVDVPRRIMTENTFMASDTHFALHLERFYNAVASVNADQLTLTKDR